MPDERLHLIAEIFARPTLWNLRSEEHKSRVCVPELWKEVAANMGPNVTVDDCKRKWKNLRDAYRAELKRMDMRIQCDILKGAYDPKKDYGCKWIYFEHMRFIKDVKRPRRKILKKENLNVSPSNDTYDEDDNDLEEFSELHNIDGVKMETHEEVNAETYKLGEENEVSDSQMYSEILLREAEKHQLEQQQRDSNENLAQTIPAIKFNMVTQSSSSPHQQATDDKPEPSCSKCSKRSYEQMHFLEDLEKEEQKLIKSTCLDITRTNNLDHVGDSDYNFLVSFLPQLKKMSELQNLQFRAKITDLMLTIMSQSMKNDVTPASALPNKAENYNNYS